MLEQCDFMDYADYAYQLLGKSYCFVKPDTSEIVCAFTVANLIEPMKT